MILQDDPFQSSSSSYNIASLIMHVTSSFIAIANKNSLLLSKFPKTDFFEEVPAEKFHTKDLSHTPSVHTT